MSADIPPALRHWVFERANGRCEYCLLPQAASAFQHEPDHTTPLLARLKTAAGKQLADEILATRWDEWWFPKV
jgi:hypothetical protein